MKYGLSADILQAMQTVFARHPAAKRVVLYGSRALGTYQTGSDIDLAVAGQQLTFQNLLNLQIDLENLDLLHRFDVVNLNTVSNPDLLDHIQRVGVLIYQAPQLITA